MRAAVTTDHAARRFGVQSLRADYAAGRTTPRALLAHLLARIDEDSDNPVWIQALTPAQLEPYLARLDTLDPATHPLWGVPFAVKDNIDLAGIPTTAACPAYAYTPERSATAVQKLIDAGAVPLGKTNLDQFATGLVGTRSPYGEVRNAFLPDVISGGSSSGSAVALALGHCAFALGTDTAGSGRVPAALNGLVGVKPSCGLVSTRGVVPACRTLDCVSLFTHDLADADAVLAVLRGVDDADPYSRPLVLDATLPAALKIGVLGRAQREFHGNEASARLYEAALRHAEVQGATLVEIDFAPFSEAASLLYDGPWVAERWLTAAHLLDDDAEALLPVTRRILQGAVGRSAADAFRAQYRLAALRKLAAAQLARVDALLLPTIPGPVTRAAVRAEPLVLNTRLGTYTNFMNLLDMAALAVPCGVYPDGLPHGVTLCAAAGSDLRLLALAARLFPGIAGTTTAPVDDVARLDILVCGAHMSGLPLNTQLTERGALFRAAVQTAPCYRFWALPGGPPFRPAMLRCAPGEQGGSIAAEIWSLPAACWGDFVQLIPAPLGIGTVELADGRKVKGFIGEGCAAAGAEDITALGGWRAFLARRAG